MNKYKNHKIVPSKLSSPVCYANSEEVRKEFRVEDVEEDNIPEDAQKKIKDVDTIKTAKKSS